ncbi:uncharacterized protein LOC122138794 [Cyprinus carpio]|uniref:Uncharacterized protein LOC122138794 n=1 Tax=Cyprinus carpio TaxID=7962 RepID=A0A9Q9WTL7_CYPCA|nr:uncharacterized protein LOC122138794 [Cyprinus carpio]
MDEEKAAVYADLREALLEKFNISPETYRQRFRVSSVPAGESPTETYHRLRNLYQRWIRPEEHTKEDIGEAVILEQPYDTRTWVREHEPMTGLAAAKLAQQYMNAHRGGLRTQPPRGTVRSVSDRSGAEAEKSHADHTDHAQGKKSSVGKGLICFIANSPDTKHQCVLLSCPVVTWAQAKAGLQPLPDLDTSLLQGGTKGPRKSRRQRRLEKYMGTPVSKTSVDGLHTSVVSQRGKAPLHPLPVISSPFRRIAMDIVGPLERSSAGHLYILVVSDYATRYPEAFPL